MVKKVRVDVEGFGTVLVDLPKKYNRKTFKDGVGEAVAGAVGLVFDRDRESFHPVLGKGGYDWDHASQAASVSEAQTPSVFDEETKLRFCLRRMSYRVSSIAKRIHQKLHKGNK